MGGFEPQPPLESHSCVSDNTLSSALMPDLSYIKALLKSYYTKFIIGMVSDY